MLYETLNINGNRIVIETFTNLKIGQTEYAIKAPYNDAFIKYCKRSKLTWNKDEKAWTLTFEEFHAKKTKIIDKIKDIYNKLID